MRPTAEAAGRIFMVSYAAYWRYSGLEFLRPDRYFLRCVRNSAATEWRGAGNCWLPSAAIRQGPYPGVGMTRCSTILLACVALLGPGRLAAQTQATARLSFRIPVILQLETVSTGGTAVARPSFTEVRSAVVLRVAANCAWRLVPAAPADAGAGPAVEVSASVAGGTSTGFHPLAGGAPVATGGRGGAVEVVLDYRVPAGTAPPLVAYRLEAAGD